MTSPLPSTALASFSWTCGRIRRPETDAPGAHSASGNKTRGPESDHVARTLNNLAILNRRNDRFADAERDYRRSLAILEKSLGTGHPLVATSLHNLALHPQGHRGRHTRCRARGDTIARDPLQAFAGNHDREQSLKSLENRGEIRFHRGQYAGGDQRRYSSGRHHAGEGVEPGSR